MAVIEPDALDRLIEALAARGYRVVGPTRRDGAIVYEEIESAADLPAGWTDVQEPGSYRLRPRDDGKLFGYAVGPQSWKRELLPPRVRLWRAARDGAALELEDQHPHADRVAFIGVRPCELEAIAIQDRVLLGGAFRDRDYAARREGVFVVAVNCGDPAATCFCTSLGTGPRAAPGYDLALTEILDGGHRFLVEIGTAEGAEILASVPSEPAQDADREAAARVTEGAALHIRRRVDAEGLPDLLARTREHPRYAEMAGRCLTCGNCTLVCPTCFCTSVEDTTDLTGTEAERHRVWDTCFSVEYAHIHGGSIRPSAAARYRQWLTHKFGTWHDQFGTAGCVGCGRCIAWCPVGIDVTEELAAIRGGEGAHGAD